MNLPELKPINQNKLFNYDNFFLSFIELYKNKKLPNKLIFSGRKGIGKATFAYHLINYILSVGEDFEYNLDSFEINRENKSYNLVLNNSHPNLYIIDLLENKKVIEISQIKEMYNFANKSSFNNREKIIFIDNAENLNLSSSSALLKIIEEPNENIIFILIYDSSKKLLDTVKSRCLKFNFFLSSSNCKNVINKITGTNIDHIISKDLIQPYSTIGDLMNLLNLSSDIDLDLSKINLKNFLITIIDNNYYKKNDYIKNSIYKYVEFYFIFLISLNKSKKKIFYTYDYFVKKINYIKQYNLDEESFFIEFRNKILHE
tara:strand:- start:94 stop:1041 length:948 start_codon:yes stop_codon:yes gene_type:complete